MIQIAKKHAIEDELFLAATEAGAEDFEATDEMFLITTDPAHLYAVRDAINHLGFTCESAELEMIPKVYVECDIETAKENLALIDWLEELEDVDAVFHNMTIPDELQG